LLLNGSRTCRRVIPFSRATWYPPTTKILYNIIMDVWLNVFVCLFFFVFFVHVYDIVFCRYFILRTGYRMWNFENGIIAGWYDDRHFCISYYYIIYYDDVYRYTSYTFYKCVYSYERYVNYFTSSYYIHTFHTLYTYVFIIYSWVVKCNEK